MQSSLVCWVLVPKALLNYDMFRRCVVFPPLLVFFTNNSFRLAADSWCYHPQLRAYPLRRCKYAAWLNSKLFAVGDNTNSGVNE